MLVASSFSKSSLTAAELGCPRCSGSLWCSWDSFPMDGISVLWLPAEEVPGVVFGPLMVLIIAVLNAATARCSLFAALPQDAQHLMNLHAHISAHCRPFSAEHAKHVQILLTTPDSQPCETTS